MLVVKAYAVTGKMFKRCDDSIVLKSAHIRAANANSFLDVVTLATQINDRIKLVYSKVNAGSECPSIAKRSCFCGANLTHFIGKVNVPRAADCSCARIGCAACGVNKTVSALDA